MDLYPSQQLAGLAGEHWAQDEVYTPGCCRQLKAFRHISLCHRRQRHILWRCGHKKQQVSAAQLTRLFTKVVTAALA